MLNILTGQLCTNSILEKLLYSIVTTQWITVLYCLNNSFEVLQQFPHYPFFILETANGTI